MVLNCNPHFGHPVTMNINDITITNENILFKRLLDEVYDWHH